jgi:hypothetical protein
VTRYYGIYLNDHYAGSVGALELARRAAGEQEGTELGRFLATLAREIEEDRDALRRIMSAAGVRPHRHKYMATWLLEKAGRLKPNGHVLQSSPLSPLVELEALATGIGGKEMLWRALQAADAPAAGQPLDELIVRAQNQRARLEEHRLAVARDALARGAP